MEATFNKSTSLAYLMEAAKELSTLRSSDNKPTYEVYESKALECYVLVSPDVHFIMSVIGHLANSGEDSLIRVI